jgi:phosphohistidine phosphatase
MKRIILFRHGKSTWDIPGLPDVDRPLTSQGEKRTTKMAKHLIQIGVKPDLIVSSNALRALRTAEIVSEVMDVDRGRLITAPQLYHATPDAIWNVIVSLPDDVDEVMLFGHNPGFTDFANIYRFGGTEWLPTSGVALAKFDCNHWHQCPLIPVHEGLILSPKTI